MAVTAQATGTKTADNTEQILADVAVAGVFQLYLDTNGMLANDVLEVRVYETVLTSGTKRVLHFHAFYGVQPTDDKIKVSLPVANDLTDSTSLEFSIKQTFGTGRDFPWKVLKM